MIRYRKVLIVSGRVDGPTKRIAVEVCSLSIAQFPVVARPRVEVSWEPTKMANRSPERLGDFIRRIRKEKNLSLRAVSRQSARFGQKITGSYISRIENEPRRKVTADRLTALAYGLGIPAEELLARAAGLIVPGEKSEEEVRLLSMFKELSPERKMDVLKLVDLWHSEESSRRGSRRRSA